MIGFTCLDLDLENRYILHVEGFLITGKLSVIKDKDPWKFFTEGKHGDKRVFVSKEDWEKYQIGDLYQPKEGDSVFQGHTK